jgi:propanol-preferring alcohol dehydrogenase
VGLYGFGASAHIVIVIQLALHCGCKVYVCTREERHQEMARQMGATWVGSEAATPPVKLNSGILFVPAAELAPVALAALDRDGTLALAGIHMTPIPRWTTSNISFWSATCGASPPIPLGPIA